MKKPRIAFTIADANNIKYAQMLEKTVRKFHTEEELPFHIVQAEELAARLKDDPAFFYRATPTVARDLLYDYDTVIKIDADSLVLGNLSYVWTANDFDIGTVLNINRVDPQRYGVVTVANLPPQKYFNAGFVVMKSEAFVEDWYKKCMSDLFNYYQYREQDLLNLICFFGDYHVRCLDYYDMPRNAYNFWGLVSKGEWGHTIMRDGQVVLPRGEDNYPDRDVTLKVIHWAGGNDGIKMNYRAHFPSEVSDYIDTLVK